MAYESKREEMCEVAMQIILHAGDAKMKVESSLDSMKEFDFVKAYQYLKEAKEKIVLAHEAQTKIVQDEAAGNEYPNSLLFNHAQDTLMTSMSFYDIAEKVLSIFEQFNKKIEELK